LDRFCEAMISIASEVEDIRAGRADPKDNALKNAPHTAEAVSRDNWPHPYSREMAAYPIKGLRETKYWPPVARIDNVYGDRNVICACPPIEAYES
jgi:glycine dehydrogenase